jgi:O-acetylhomoserine (thiol)-lyase
MKNFETICVQGTYKPKDGEPRVLPISQSTAYLHESSDDLADLFSLSREGHIYSRISNPTVSAVEGKINLLEGGVGCLGASSGHAAMVNIIFSLCEAGDHIVSSSKIYGGVFNLLSRTLSSYNITTTFVNPNSTKEEIVSACKSNTKFIFGESISNPDMTILNFEEFSQAAKEVDVPLVIDNTLLTPFNFKPFEHGANIIIHSGSKYFDGHGVAMSGFIIDGGNYNYANGKFKRLSQPDPSYNNIVYTDTFKEAAFITRARTCFTRDFGNYLSPFNAFLIHMNLETLHLRMEKHNENALKLANFLIDNENVENVYYPALKGSRGYDQYLKYMDKGISGVLSFLVKGGREQAKALTSKLQLATIVTHLGDLRTIVLHPASTTHSQLDEEALINAGVLPNLIRVSVGIENIDDIIEDFKQALE